MSRQRLAALSEKLRENRVDHALLCSLASLRYFTGYTAAIETGPSPFTSVLGALLLVRGEEPALLLADMESTAGLDDGIAVDTFSSYTIEKPLAAVQDLAGKLAGLLKGLPPGKVGIESDDLPAAVAERLRSECPGLEFPDVTRLLSEMRMIKDEEEIRTLREACALCDVGQELVKKLARPGMNEVELFEEVRRGIEIAEGGRVPLLADLVSGPRTAEIGGPPSARRIEPGELIIADLVPRHNGYWGDSCNTCVAGDATREQLQYFKGITDSLGEAIAQVRPGVRACDLDAALRKRVLRLGGGYPHHSGHGLGVTWHEEPRVVPYNNLALAANMVIALEPGIYFKGRWGMRFESVIRVTQGGAEVLSKFRHTL